MSLANALHIVEASPSGEVDTCAVEWCDNKKKPRKGGYLRKYCTMHEKKPYTRNKKDHCEYCGFKPIWIGQLDVDHVDGNHDNNDESNLQTLCANCHRLKTHLNDDTRQETMSKKLLKEGLKKPKEQTVKEKPYTVKASVEKAVKDLKAMSKDRGSLPL